MGNSSSKAAKKAAKTKDKRKTAEPAANEPPAKPSRLNTTQQSQQRSQPTQQPQQSQLRSQATQQSSQRPTTKARTERPVRESAVTARPSQLPAAAAAHNDDKCLAESARLTAAKARALATGPSRPLFAHAPLFVGNHPAARTGMAQTKRVFDVSVVEGGGATTASEAADATLHTRGSTCTSALTLRPPTGESTVTDLARPTSSGLIFSWADRIPLSRAKVDELLQELVDTRRLDAAARDNCKRRLYERARRRGVHPTAYDIRKIVKH